MKKDIESGSPLTKTKSDENILKQKSKFIKIQKENNESLSRIQKMKEKIYNTSNPGSQSGNY